MAFLMLLVIAITGGILWFKIQANESATKEYNEKLALARRVLETAQNIRYELLADLNEIGGKLGSANRDEYKQLFREKEDTERFVKRLEVVIPNLEEALRWKTEVEGGRAKIEMALLDLSTQSGLTLEEWAKNFGLKI